MLTTEVHLTKADMSLDSPRPKKPLTSGELEALQLFRSRYTTDVHYANIGNRFILGIPDVYKRFWLSRGQPTRSPNSLEKIPRAKSLRFDMFFPDFGGYTEQNFLDRFHPDLIEIVEVSPVSSEEYAKAPAAVGDVEAIRRNIGDRSWMNPKLKQERYGMECYKRELKENDQYTCFGVRSNGEPALVRVAERTPRTNWPPNPHAQILYYSKAWGGVEVIFRISQKHAEQWREADDAIWSKLNAWVYKKFDTQ